MFSGSHLPFGRYQNKPTGSHSAEVPAWRIPKQWSKTSLEKYLYKDKIDF